MNGGTTGTGRVCDRWALASNRDFVRQVVKWRRFMAACLINFVIIYSLFTFYAVLISALGQTCYG